MQVFLNIIYKCLVIVAKESFMENKFTNTDIRATVGNRLKQLRIARELSQDALGKLCNLSRGSICCYERGERTPDIEMLLKFSQIFNTSIDYLVGLTSNVHPDNRILGNTIGLSDSSIETLRELKESKDSYNKEVLATINLLLDIEDYESNINYFRNIYAFIKTKVNNNKKVELVCNSPAAVSISQEDMLYALLLSNNSYLAKLREREKNNKVS